jgi:hypothetical protein
MSDDAPSERVRRAIVWFSFISATIMVDGIVAVCHAGNAPLAAVGGFMLGVNACAIYVVLK